MLSKLDNLYDDCGFHYTAGSIHVFKTLRQICAVFLQYISCVGHVPLHFRDVKAFRKHVHSLKSEECHFSIASCRHTLWQSQYILYITHKWFFFSYNFLLITTSGRSWNGSEWPRATYMASRTCNRLSLDSPDSLYSTQQSELICFFKVES